MWKNSFWNVHINIVSVICMYYSNSMDMSFGKIVLCRGNERSSKSLSSNSEVLGNFKNRFLNLKTIRTSQLKMIESRPSTPSDGSHFQNVNDLVHEINDDLYDYLLIPNFSRSYFILRNLWGIQRSICKPTYYLRIR